MPAVAIPTAQLVNKKMAYVTALVQQAQAAKAANDQLAILAAEYTNQYAAGQAVALVDADFLVGSNTHLNAAALSTFFSGYQPALAAAHTNNLQALLAVLPQ
jgi:hypothetical protein